MNSTNNDCEYYIDIIEQMLSENNISQQNFNIFQTALDNISKIYSEQTISHDDAQNLQNVITSLKEYFQQDIDAALYKSVLKRIQRSRDAVMWLRQSYNLKRQAENTGKALHFEDQVGTPYLEDQNSIGVSKEYEKEKPTIASSENRENKGRDNLSSRKNEEENLNNPSQANVIEKTNNFIKTSDHAGDNHHIQSFVASGINYKLHEEKLHKMVEEIAELKNEIKLKERVHFDLNMQLVEQKTQNQSTKEHLNTVASQLEARTSDVRVNKEELSKKTREIENLSKEITELRKHNLTEISNKDTLQYKVTLLEKQLQKMNDKSDSLQSKLSLKDDQLKKLEVEIEAHRKISVYESRQHQEKSKELQEFKSKSTELQNNLRGKGDELITKLRELNECKNDLVNYANMNGNIKNQLALLEKDHEALEFKFKAESINHQKEITSLTKQLNSERKTSGELIKQVESFKEQLKEQKESYNRLEPSYNDLQGKFSKAASDLGDANATITNLKNEIKMKENENSDFKQNLERLNACLQMVNDRLFSAEEQNKIVSSKLSEAESQVKQTQKSLEATEEERRVCNDKFYEEKDENVKLKKTFEFQLSQQNENRNKLKTFIDKLLRSQTLEEICESERESVKKTAFLQLDTIKAEVVGYRESVRKFSDIKLSKSFLHFQELIQRSIEKIDRIQSQDILEIKAKKKELIKYCQTVDEELQRNATSA